MKRRDLLASAGAALSSACAGCLGPSFGESPERVVSLAGVGEVGGGHPFRLDVEMRSRAMGEGAPELAVTLRNATERAWFLGYAGSWPAGGLLPGRGSDPAALRLLAESEVSGVTVEHGECPVTEYRPPEGDRDAGRRVVPGEGRRVACRVVGAAGKIEEGCPPPGRYRFRAEYPYAPAPAVEREGFDEADRDQFAWGFSLDVSGR